jgi:hypothetical protein
MPTTPETDKEIDLCIAAMHALKVIWNAHGITSPAAQAPVDDLANMLEQGANPHPRTLRRVIANALRANFGSPSAATPPTP